MDTIQKIWEARETEQKPSYRQHLGASLIGRACERAIWKTWRWVTIERHSGRLLRLFETGHLAEARIVSDLRLTGATVYDHDPETGQQFNLRDESGHFGGSMDGVAIGVLEAPEIWHVLEFKTHNQKSFDKLRKDGVKVSKPEHYAQMQTYMMLSSIEWAVYLAVCKNDDDLYFERVSYDADYAALLLDKAHRIIGAASPPERISSDPAWHECRFCAHHATCHGEKLPEMNCRTCIFSSPIEDGSWRCEKRNCVIPYDLQIKGCLEHLFLPQLVAGEQVDADPEGRWVEYKTRNGNVWRNGTGLH
jgi:hypothetical protein